MRCNTPGHPRVAVAAIVVALLVPAVAAAQGGWLPTTWFAPTQVDTQAMHPLAENDGPWLVLATTFRGESARDEARRLVQELRSRHKLDAYTHEKSFDYTGRQQGIGLNPDGTPKTMRYANAGHVVEVAVLVGDFASCEDPRGQAALQRIKTLRPESLGGPSGKSRLVSDFLLANRDQLRTGGPAAEKPPMHAAILIPNPLLPDGYFAPQQIDDFVLAMNADVEHSLLDCPGRFTVRVATFTGAGTFDPGAAADSAAGGRSDGLVDVNRFVEALRGTGWRDPQVRARQSESRLVEAADKAHRLTVALRRAGWPAWEFHDRESSIVCVGSVDQLAVPQAAGRPAVHPEITRIVRELGPDPAGLAQGRIVPKSFAGVMLDLEPKPIDVPRAPTRRR